MSGFLDFIDRYVWEVAWRATMESLLIESDITLIAIRFGRNTLWFDGEWTA